MNKIEEINLKSIDTNPFSKGEKKMNSVSKLLEKIGLIEQKTKDYTLIKQQNFDDNVVTKENLPPIQNEGSKMKDSEDEKNIANEKNKINYSIKVISPPAVFNINSGNIPQTPNKFKPITKKNTNSILENPQALYPSKSHVKRTQEVIPKKQNFNYYYGGKENTMKPKLQNKINIAGSKSSEMLGRERKEIVENTLNKIESPLESKYRKSIHDLKDNRNPLKFNSESRMPSISNTRELPTNFLEVPLKIDIVPDVINEEKANSINTIDKEVEYNMVNYNLNRFYADEHKLNPNYLLPGQSSPKLLLQSNPALELNSPTNQVYNSNDFVNPSLSFSLDKLITFFTSKFLSIIPNISEDSPDKRQVSFTPLTSPTYTNLHENMSSCTDISQTPSESIPSGNELEFNEHINIEEENFIVQDALNKESKTKLSSPYLSTLTINYIPSLETSNEIVIIV
ncbi:unnamed protein product [Danaus chrysippus]|uniref:(African queen) hypothetical protein n=1 Tax=Danaus chrysippus TaxID=151541 RepID=A0A8J2W881_9NEOP|nr:unnamed protein product [Danaus chrysippus]